MHTTLTTGWWTCSDCGIDAELPGPDTTGFLVTCPDCGTAMVEQWQWEPAAQPARPLTRAA